MSPPGPEEGGGSWPHPGTQAPVDCAVPSSKERGARPSGPDVC